MGTETEYDDINQASSNGGGAQIINIDNGKYIAVVALCAAICGVAVVYAWYSTTVARDVDVNYQVLLNHQTKIESRLEYVEYEIKELKHAEQRR